jgi:hypothetical protein
VILDPERARALDDWEANKRMLAWAKRMRAWSIVWCILATAGWLTAAWLAGLLLSG